MLIYVVKEVFVDLSLFYVGFCFCLYVKKDWFLFFLKNWVGYLVFW